MRRIKEFGLGKIITFCLVFFLLAHVSMSFEEQMGKLNKREQFILKDITIQLQGPASRVMVESSGPYLVKDADCVACRFNGIGITSYVADRNDAMGIMRELREVRSFAGTMNMPACIFGAWLQNKSQKKRNITFTFARDNNGISYQDWARVVAENEGAVAVVGPDGKSVSLADGAIVRTFKGDQDIPIFEGDDGNYYFDIPKLVHDGGATIVGQDGKSISLADEAITLTFKGNQDIPITKDQEGNYCFDYPKLVAEGGATAILSGPNENLPVPVSKNKEGNYYFDFSQLVHEKGVIKVSQKSRCKNTNRIVNYNLDGIYSMSEGEDGEINMIGRGLTMYVKSWRT